MATEPTEPTEASGYVTRPGTLFLSWIPWVPWRFWLFAFQGQPRIAAFGLHPGYGTGMATEATESTEASARTTRPGTLFPFVDSVDFVALLTFGFSQGQ